jgi:diguanylate cyclase (GGDEF)-like protein
MAENLSSFIQSSFLALSPLTKMEQVLESMVEARKSCVLVVEDQKLRGIFTERDVVKIMINRALVMDLTLGELMSPNPISLKVSEIKDIFSVSRILKQHQIRHLPILDEQNQVVGVITPQSIRNQMKPEHLLRYVRVEEVMKKKVISGLPDDSVLVLAQKMAIHRISCVVIIEPSTFLPLGIVTERDLVQFHSLALDFAQVSAESVMSTPLSIVKPHDSLWEVHQQMQELKVRRLVVTQVTGELAGIVTQTQMLKMLDPTEMYQVVRQMQEIIERQTTELQQLNQKLQKRNQELVTLSTLDELTQIVNRRKLNEFLQGEWQRLGDLGKPLSVIMCDVDHFKEYNDHYGHLAGDDCLLKVAQTLRSVTREASDLVARYGGEEFTVVLPNTNQTGAERVAKTILTEIQKRQIPHELSPTASYVTVSLGVATIYPEPTKSPEILLQVADQLLYQSKQKGRNTYTLAFLSR